MIPPEAMLSAAEALEGRALPSADAAELLAFLGGDAALAPFLRHAAGLRRVFALAAPWAPGLCAWGAEVETPLGGSFASGVGVAHGPAFMACVAEAMERAAVASAPPVALRGPAPAWAARLPAMPAEVDCLAPGLPLDLAFRRAAPEFRPPWPLSAGCAVGPDAGAACLSALLELIERDAVALWFEGGHPPAPLALEQAAPAAAALAEIRAGFTGRASWLLDISQGLGVPVVVAASADAATGGDVCLGFAARPTPAAAARAAVLEMAQMELALSIVARRARERGEAGLNASDKVHLARAGALRAGMAGLMPQGAPRRHGPAPGLGDLCKSLQQNGILAQFLPLPGGGGPLVAMRALAPMLDHPGALPRGPRFRAVAPPVAEVELL
ncbi:YcaO-like family protein [Rhodovarius lipocyclicus]|uniref:YcaO-like family protein n=1 Tax=Rhodovarius lipocyclicus TaxID=268410 RepID=UPI001359E265|nr:YcaO-like family protein [Rhodovarius lipocyclicus]